MSDGYSETAKTFWKGTRKALEKAVERARPFGAYVHSPLTPYLRINKLGDTGTVQEGTVSTLRPGQPLPGDRVIAVTLDTGEVIVLGAVRDGSSEDVTLVTSPLIWRRTLAEVSPVKLEWTTPGLVEVTDGVLAANGVSFHNFTNTSTLSTASTVSVASPGVNFVLPNPGTYTVTARVSVAAANSTAGAICNMKVRINSLDGTELPFVLTSTNDVSMNNMHRITGYVYDGVTPLNVGAWVRTNVGTLLTKGSVTQLIAERTA